MQESDHRRLAYAAKGAYPNCLCFADAHGHSDFVEGAVGLGKVVSESMEKMGVCHSALPYFLATVMIQVAGNAAFDEEERRQRASGWDQDKAVREASDDPVIGYGKVMDVVLNNVEEITIKSCQSMADVLMPLLLERQKIMRESVARDNPAVSIVRDREA